jgi:hypothetical protein
MTLPPGTLPAIVAILAAGVGTAFCADLTAQFRRRRRPHAGVWAASLGLFALACTAVSLGVWLGWSPFVYGVFWFAGALVTVPLLAAGQLLLLDPRRRALWLALAAAAVVAGAVAVLTSGMDRAALAAADTRGGIPVGAEVFGSSLAMALLSPFNWSGLVVVAGCGWSAVRTRRPGVLLIAVGVLVAGASFSFVRGGAPSAFAATLAVGVSIMYAGFRAAGTPRRDPRSVPAAGTDARAQTAGAGTDPSPTSSRHG